MKKDSQETIPVWIIEARKELPDGLPTQDDWRAWILWNEKNGLTDYHKNQKPLFDLGIQHLHRKLFDRLNLSLPANFPPEAKGAISAIVSSCVEYLAMIERGNFDELLTPYLRGREKEISEAISKAYLIGMRLNERQRETFLTKLNAVNKIVFLRNLPRQYDKTFSTAHAIESLFREGTFPTRKEVNDRMNMMEIESDGGEHDLDKPLKHLEIKLRDSRLAAEKDSQPT